MRSRLKMFCQNILKNTISANATMSFSRDSRFREHEARLQESVWARQSVPSSQDYQSVGETLLSPNKPSLAGTTFGASARAVLSPTNHTVQGKMAGFATHRKQLSPRPGPGAHKISQQDNRADKLWLESSTNDSLEAERVKCQINQLNFRLSGELPHETTSSKILRERRNDLCRKMKSMKSLVDAPNVSFSYSLDQSGNIASTVSRNSHNVTIRPETAM